jgi:hypothetical protein
MSQLAYLQFIEELNGYDDGKIFMHLSNKKWRIVHYSTQTPTIYWNWLRQTLILSRLSSLGVGVSRSVMSDQREWISDQDTPTPTHIQLSECQSLSFS